mgnify:CR=1 FL=1
MDTKALESSFDQLLNYTIAYFPKLILAVVTLVIGLKLVNLFSSFITKILHKKDVEPSLASFLNSVSKIGLKVLLIVSVVSMVGVEMTSFIALLGGAGVAAGMALSGTLQNFSGGVIILIFKPFKVGDFIEAQGYMGTVREIQIFNTILKTPDNKTVVIPNAPLSNSSLINFTAEKTRRVDFIFGIGYDSSIDQARDIIRNLIESDIRILKEPNYEIVVGSLGDSSVNLTVRVWANLENYWPVFFDLNESVKKAFDKEGIVIPFPQRDVHLYQTQV